jgi:hypothetical protein
VTFDSLFQKVFKQPFPKGFNLNMGQEGRTLPLKTKEKELKLGWGPTSLLGLRKMVMESTNI